MIKLTQILITLSFTLLPMVSLASEAAKTVALTACSPERLQGEGNLNFSTYANKLLYVDFWASWCGPCKLSFPFMNALKKEYPDTKLEIIAISVDKKVADAEKFLNRTPAKFTTALDSSGSCPTAFGVEGMPHSFIIDTEGKVLYSHVGFRPSDPETLHSVIRKLINEHK